MSLRASVFVGLAREWVGVCVWGSNKVHTLMYFTLGWTSFKVDKGGLLDEVLGEGQGL